MKPISVKAVVRCKAAVPENYLSSREWGILRGITTTRASYLAGSGDLYVDDGSPATIKLGHVRFIHRDAIQRYAREQKCATKP